MAGNFSNSLDALNGIFGLLSKISDNAFIAANEVPKKGSTSASTDVASGKAGILGKVGNLKETATGIKNVAEAVVLLTKNLTKFAVTPGKNSLINFIKNLNNTLGAGDNEKSSRIKTSADAIVGVVNSMMAMSKGIIVLSLLTATGATMFAMLGIKLIAWTVSSLGKNSDKIGKGASVLKGMGKTLGIFALSLIGFALGMVAVGALFGLSGIKGVAAGIGMIAVSIGILAFVFWGIGMMEPLLKNGMDTVKSIGWSIVILSLSLLAFAFTSILLSSMLKTPGGVLGAIGIMSLSILMLGGVFFIIGKLKGAILQGALVMILMGVSLLVMSFGLNSIINVAKNIANLGQPKEAFKILGIALGSIAITGAIMAGLGAAAVFIIPGAIAAIIMGAALLVVSKGVVKVVEASQQIKTMLKDDNLTNVVKNMIGGPLKGIIQGYNDAMKGENPIKVMFKLGVAFAIVGVISSLGNALQAFTKAGSITPIEGYDEKGKPKFGQPVDIAKITDNILNTFTLFLGKMIDLTKNVDMHQAKVLKKLGKALTGDRGIMSAVMDFAKVIEVYGKYGAEGKIGSFEYDKDGHMVLDKDGKPKMVATSITGVVDIFTKNFTDFVTKLASSLGQITGQERRRMKKMSKALSGSIFQAVVDFASVIEVFAKYGPEGKIVLLDEDGKPIKGKEPMLITNVVDSVVKSFTTFVDLFAKGMDSRKDVIEQMSDLSKDYFDVGSENSIFTPALRFSEFIKTISETYNDDGTMQLTESDGKRGKKVNVGMLIASMTKSFNLLIDGLTNMSFVSNTKLPKDNKMQAALINVSILNTRISELVKQKDGLEKTAEALGKVAIKMSDFSKAVDLLNTEKLKSLGDIAAFQIQAEIENKEKKTFGEGLAKLNGNTYQQNTYTKPLSGQSQAPEIDWDSVALTIGDQVGQAVSNALRNGQFTFEFAGGDMNSGIFSLRPK